MKNLQFVPIPKQVTDVPGQFDMGLCQVILIDSPKPVEQYACAERLRGKVKEKTGKEIKIICGKPMAGEENYALIRVANDVDPRMVQGYHLTISPSSIMIESRGGAGVFYGTCTLEQIIYQSTTSLPCLKIIDWPDFESRGIMLDVSRDKVYRLETLFFLIDKFASWKFNQLQLYIEHTYAYRAHPAVWKDASPLTSEDIILLDQYCKDRFIELVPNLNSLGHMERWLKHPEYAHLAETHEKFPVPWGYKQGPFSLSPVLPETKEFIAGLYDEILPNFSSRKFNIGCDETFDIGFGKSSTEASRIGKERVYLEFLLFLYREANSRGFSPQFWGDIILRHPKLISELPSELTALLWGYESDHPFHAECSAFAESGLPYYVCPGTSAWNSIVGRTDNCIGNIASATQNGLTHNAVGILTTDWGDNGHWQMLPISFLGFVYSAACSWGVEKNKAINLPEALNLFGFADPSKKLGVIAFELGNIYRMSEAKLHNSSPLFWLLSRRSEDLKEKIDVTKQNLLDIVDTVSKITDGLHDVDQPITSLFRREFELSIRMVMHACKRGLYFMGEKGNEDLSAEKLKMDLRDIMDEYRAVWLIRNNPGGLVDSVGRLETVYNDYL